LEQGIRDAVFWTKATMLPSSGPRQPCCRCIYADAVGSAHTLEQGIHDAVVLEQGNHVAILLRRHGRLAPYFDAI
jgi:hypothetical protein